MTLRNLINPADRIGGDSIFYCPIADYQIPAFLMKQALRIHFNEKKECKNHQKS
jgi:hypothetical protein